ncbi:MAG TPA: MarR family transcriptional regulator [Thermoanaerobaculia bacterium]|nr:MarR family transcriptional regulator [Thermoanaerobaculia bacterium]
MNSRHVVDVQRFYPQIYLACHVDHVRAASTKWRLSSRDSSLLSHLDTGIPTSPRDLAAHLGVVPSTLSATIARLTRLGYISSTPRAGDRRQRELRLTYRGAEAMASTSVLDAERVASLLGKLSPREQRDAVRGLALLARAARAMKEEKE